MTLFANVLSLPVIILERFRSLPFYLVAILLHLLFVLVFGTYEVSHSEGSGVVSVFTAPSAKVDDKSVAPPPPPPDRATRDIKAAQLPASAARSSARISVMGGASSSQVLVPAAIASPASTYQPAHVQGSDMKIDTGNMSAGMPALKLRQMLTRASVFVQSGTGVSGTGRGTRAKFACYWAIYQGGDWNCNPAALPNLMTQVGRWSKDRIQQKVEPTAIVLSSKDLFTIKPPFVFITGHKDFTFTEEEVENLRQYLHAGGAIWADNDLPGRRSRFDIAFRREMKRVLTDRDFEKITNDHPIMFSYFPLLRKLPSGMNFYQEPIEVIRLIADEIAVIYTLNAYGDLWESALDENDKIDRQLYRTSARNGYHKWGPHFGNYYTSTHYRNVNDDTVVGAYKLGINIVVHLLNRYDDRLRGMGVQH